MNDRPDAKPPDEPQPTRTNGPAPQEVDRPAIIRPAAVSATKPPDPPPTGYPTETGAFDLPSRVYGNPTVTCHWARPSADVAGRRPPRADDVVVYLHYPDERGFFADDGKRPSARLFTRLASEGGFTVMGVWFDGQGAKVMDHFDRANRSKSYIFPESGSVDTLVEAHRRLIAQLGIPPKPLLLFGLSGGGIEGQQFAEYRPDLVDGLACHGGAGFSQYQDRPRSASRTAFLFSWTAGDACDAQNRAVSVHYRRAGNAVAAIETPIPWEHRGQSWIRHPAIDRTFVLMIRYLEGLSDLRRSSGGDMPGHGGWPRGSVAGEDDIPPYSPCVKAFTGFARAPTSIARFPGAHLARSPRPAGQLVILRRGDWSPNPLNTKPDADPEWDLRQYADRGFDALYLDPRHAPALAEVFRSEAMANHDRVYFDLQDPGPEDIAAILACPGATGAVLAYTQLPSGGAVADATARLLTARMAVHVAAIGTDATAAEAIRSEAVAGRIRFADTDPNRIAAFTSDLYVPNGKPAGIDAQRLLVAAIAAFRRK